MLRGFLIVVLIQATLGMFPTLWRHGPVRGPEFGSRFQRQTAPVAVADDDQVTLAPIAVSTGFFAQATDHFDNTSTATFSQRYFYTEYFMRGSAAFLVLNGETPAVGDWMGDLTVPVVQRAQKYNAGLFQLEHRYYGMSRPFPTQTTENLKFLTVAQAIEDVASFIKFANQRFNLPKDMRWIVVGAGYAGNLAAWLRAAHPELVVGAIASSAPMQLKLDYWEYNDQVATSISDYGSTQCFAGTMTAFRDVIKLMATPEGRNQIDATLPLQTPLANLSLTYNDIQQFYGVLYEPFQVAVQFNSEFGLSIKDLCSVMTNNTLSSLEKLKGVYAYLWGDLQGNPGVPMLNDYAVTVQALQDVTYNDVNGASLRSFTWQTCNEIGWLISTDTDMRGPFGASQPLNLIVNQCQDVFGKDLFPIIKMRDAIEATNNAWGGSEYYSGTNVVFTYGSIDPFTRIGLVYGSKDVSVTTYVMLDCSFAEDQFPKSVNNKDLDRAQKVIDNNIYNWLNGPINPVTRYNFTTDYQQSSIEQVQAAQVESSKGRKVVRKPARVRGDSPLAGQELFVKLPDDVPSKKTFPISNKYKKMWLGRPPHGFLPEPDNGQMADYPPGFEVGMFRQVVDHYDRNNPDIFQQKFYKNAQWAKPGGPNFLMIGGEGPESDRWVLSENLTYLTWAQKYGATVYLLEHRFYGDSVVGDNQDFSYLMARQMLHDLAEFIKAINYKTGNTAPWITFGGSYSGALSLWMRQRFPDLVAGAVGSSGPVYAKDDFYEYLVVVENSIRTYSNDCANQIGVAFDEMHRMVLSPAGRVNLTTIFTLDPPWTVDSVVGEIDTAYFFSNIFGNFQGAVQYSGDNTGPYANGYGIPDMCKIMLNDSNTPLQNVANFNVFMTEFYTGGAFQGTDNKYQDMIDALKTAQQYGPASAASLLWTWQTCNEFGYFQSTDLGAGIFGSPTPVNMYFQMCADVFDMYNTDRIRDNIDETNAFYGSRDNYQGTNVVMPNGSLDPWHALGKLTSTDPTVVPYLINGTAHCADMYPARDQDAPGLAIVRTLIDTNLAQWISQQPIATTASTIAAGNSTGPSSTATTQSPVATTSDAMASLRFEAAVVLLLTLAHTSLSYH